MFLSHCSVDSPRAIVRISISYFQCTAIRKSYLLFLQLLCLQIIVISLADFYSVLPYTLLLQPDIVKIQGMNYHGKAIDTTHIGVLETILPELHFCIEKRVVTF